MHCVFIQKYGVNFFISFLFLFQTQSLFLLILNNMILHTKNGVSKKIHFPEFQVTWFLQKLKLNDWSLLQVQSKRSEWSKINQKLVSLTPSPSYQIQHQFLKRQQEIMPKSHMELPLLQLVRFSFLF